ncbi:MAG TPA: alcohol dehydrogenase catalytic domain-containing protein [Ktedonobacterales bacterium]
MERQSLLLVAPRQIEWRAEKLPQPGARDVLVQTIAGAVSIGTELPQYMGTERLTVAHGYPRMTGYESLGVVVARGSDVRDLRIGERVVAFYGHRTHAIVAQERALRVPEGVSDALALLVILTCDVAKGIRKLAPLPEEAVLVTGAGGIGLLTVWVLRAYGVRSVDVIEPRAERRRLALRLGARWAGGPGEQPPVSAYPVGIECSSRDAGFALLQQSARAGGRICVLADGNVEPLQLAPYFHTKELSIVGSSDGWDYHQHARWYFDVVREGAPGLEALFEMDVAATDLPLTFERMARGEISPTKVLVRYAKAQS